MEKKYYMQIGIVLVVALVMVQSVSASLNLDPAAMPAYRGSSPFTAGGVLSGHVDYAVFAPGQYDGTVSFPGLYVYAYQVFSNPSSTVSIDYFSVGLKPGVSASNPSWDLAAGNAVPGGSVPTYSYVMPQQVIDLFIFDNINPSGHSTTLLFTSNAAPIMAEGVVSAGVAGGAIMPLPTPSPAPEPATLGLLIGGALMVIRRKRKV
jgi:hypothetical protein